VSRPPLNLYPPGHGILRRLDTSEPSSGPGAGQATQPPERPAEPPSPHSEVALAPDPLAQTVEDLVGLSGGARTRRETLLWGANIGQLLQAKRKAEDELRDARQKIETLEIELRQGQKQIANLREDNGVLRERVRAIAGERWVRTAVAALGPVLLIFAVPDVTRSALADVALVGGIVCLVIGLWPVATGTEKSEANDR
jgi:hypothetical protein